MALEGSWAGSARTLRADLALGRCSCLSTSLPALFSSEHGSLPGILLNIHVVTHDPPSRLFLPSCYPHTWNNAWNIARDSRNNWERNSIHI